MYSFSFISFLFSFRISIAMPMGQMPVLEVDGHRVHQSISMARYVAKRVGLGGANPWEDLIIDTAVDTVNDFRLSKYHLHCVPCCVFDSTLR